MNYQLRDTVTYDYFSPSSPFIQAKSLTKICPSKENPHCHSQQVKGLPFCITLTLAGLHTVSQNRDLTYNHVCEVIITCSIISPYNIICSSEVFLYLQGQLRTLSSSSGVNREKQGNLFIKVPAWRPHIKLLKLAFPLIFAIFCLTSSSRHFPSKEPLSVCAPILAASTLKSILPKSGDCPAHCLVEFVLSQSLP